MRKILFLAMALMLAFGLNAQVRTGDIYGKVTDPEGNPLPGVTVALTGSVVGKLEAVTNEQGIFHFKSLAPANDYEVTAELESFKKGVHKNVQVLIGGNTEVNFQMQLGVMTEEVIVVGTAQVVNPKNTQVATVVTRTELQSLPTGRDPFIILAMAPGVQTDRENMAGSESGQQATSVGRGTATYDNNLWNVDGINVTDPAAIGATPTYWDFDVFEEMSVTTGGADVTIQTGGIALNMVTRRGGNRQSLGGRFYVTDSAFQDDNITDDLRARGVTNIVGIRNIKDYGFNMGGPVIKNKMYYWMSYGVQDIKTKTLIGANDDTLLTNYAFKLNIQPIEANRFEAFLHAGGKTKEGRDVAVATPQGRGQGGQYHFGSPILKLQDEHTFGSNLFLSLKYAFSDAGFKLWPMIDPTMSHMQWRNITTTVRTGSYGIYDVKRPKTNYAGQLTYFNDKLLGGSHEFLLGAEYTKMRQEFLSGQSGSGTTHVRYAYNTAQLDLNGDGINEVPGSEWMQWLNARPIYGDTYVTQYSAYLQDNMTYGKFMVKAGLRLDFYQPELKAISFDGMPINHPTLKEIADDSVLQKLDTLFPAAEAPAVKPSEYRWTVLSPRFGLTWDINGNGKTILKLALSEYGDTMGTGTTGFFFPYGTGGFMNFWWKDNGDRKVQFNELYFVKLAGKGTVPYRIYDDAGNLTLTQSGIDASFNRSWGGFNWGSSSTEPAHQLVDGQFSSTNTYEALATFEKELSKDLAISVNATYRLQNNFWYNLAYYPDTGETEDSSFFSPAGTVPATITTNTGAVISTKDAAGKTWYAANSKYQIADWFKLSNLHDPKNSFIGLDLMLTKRLSDKWMASASFTYQFQKSTFGATQYTDPVNADPNSGTFTPNPTNFWAYENQPYAPFIGGASGKINAWVYSRWMVKLSGLYQLPWDINLSAVFTAHEGNIIREVVNLCDERLPNPDYNNVAVELTPFGSKRLPVLWDLGLRAEKMIKVGENQSVYVMFDLFNVFNNNMVDRQYDEFWGTYYIHNGTFSPNATNGTIYNIVNPRVFRLGVRFQF